MSDENFPDNMPNIAHEIEELVWELDIPYMEAAILLTERLDIEPEVVAAHISGNQALLYKIRQEAEALNFIERENRLEV